MEASWVLKEFSAVTLGEKVVMTRYLKKSVHTKERLIFSQLETFVYFYTIQPQNSIT
jgi:hypothetical protein